MHNLVMNVVPRIKLLESWRKRPSHLSFTDFSTTPTFILPKIWTGHIYTYPQDRQSLRLLASCHAEGEAFRTRLKCLGKEVDGELGNGSGPCVRPKTDSWAVIPVTEISLARVPRALEGEARGGSSLKGGVRGGCSVKVTVKG